MDTAMFVPATAIDHAIDEACQAIAPLWPLDRFVAVNPFLGWTGTRFAEAAARLGAISGARLTMPRAYYRDAAESGRIDAQDVRAATRDGAVTATEAMAALAGPPAPAPAPVALTVAELRGPRIAALATAEIAKHCAAYWDAGQAAWPMPWRDLPLYPAWRAALAHDRSVEANGLAGFRAAAIRLPADARAAVRMALDELGVPPRSAFAYLLRALSGVSGWAGHARRLDFEAGLAGGSDDNVLQVLAIRLAWERALLESATPAEQARWADAFRGPSAPTAAEQRAAEVDAALQRALEHGYQRRLIATLAATPPAHAAQAPAVSAQAAFCIDVRSEVFRRALEATDPSVQTIGFAGFFGVAVEVAKFGATRGAAHCPVLLRPSALVCEAPADPAQAPALRRRLARDRRASAALAGFRTAAVAAFGFVETLGLPYAARLLRDSLPRPARHAAPQTAPVLEPGTLDGRATGIAPAARVALAASILRGLSLTGGFARLVLLAGHGGTSANNPHAAGLDCGACGGQQGDANARLAAALLNDPAVRAGLGAHGIAVPAETWFVAGLHDTTTDTVQLFDTAGLPASHAPDMRKLAAALARAGIQARQERAPGLGTTPQALFARAADWAQTRPEWGLADNAAFIAAPRRRTAGRKLDGRAFLHSYDAAQDPDGHVLELIMTAPMVVASWINLQYYGSTVDNRAYGSGNKTLHNVVGRLGVVEGNGGDLRPGLPWQSLHDGRALRHEPLRLSVFIEAPTEAIDRVVAAHAPVRDLLAHEWLHLFAIEGDGAIRRWRAPGAWMAETARAESVA